ncbi:MULTISPECIES: TetR/AcrR family transcriptional regulator [unclassified Nocardiopsis]|uniref:TetR/AcrR family transcriptional regulator n=1 Tax=unclassified Nocardiopsis TaxID=2649073 RepID=UPI00066A6D32|nr:MULTISPECIES: TetR/AcrR family transcriptional regulator [unclassified Nocardiopsis]MBQ1084405.1 TetR/AcrR family transcriptional regulator [Nocardiopsis sp. B62]
MDELPGKRRRATAEETRERILDSAAEVLRRSGLAQARTKEIARVAGYSEATLYKHFDDKTDLLLAVMRHRFPPFVDVLAELPTRVGHGQVRETLTEVTAKAVRFFEHGSPLLGSLFADPELLRRHRENMLQRGAGPFNVNRALADYLRAERDLGRIRPDTDPEAVSSLLVGACFQRGFFEAFSGGLEGFPPVERFTADLVAAALPHGPGEPS